MSSGILVTIICLFGLNGALAQYCTLPGQCPTPAPPTGTNTIDIRIVVPTPAAVPTILPGVCPPGYILCNPTAVTCGTRLVSPVAADNGNATAGAHPWLVFMANQTGYTGGGVLLDQYHVLTAAHKVAANVATPTNIRLYFGVWDPNAMVGTQNRTAVRIILHPSYNPANLFNDIAIIRLDNPVVLGVQSTINTACLPTQGASYVGSNCMVAGWGQSAFTVFNSPVTPLRQVTVPVVAYAICRASFAQSTVLSTNVDTFLDPTGEICAGGVASLDACTNDGGAPLMCLDPITSRYTIVGLVLWGKGCGATGIYGVYNNVPYYRSWIDSTLATLNAG